MYERLTRSRIRLEISSPAYLGLGIIKIIILPTIHVWRTPVFAYNSRLLAVRDYLKFYFGMYSRLTRSHISVELAFPAY